jgi:peptide/nickel transport system permease protein
MSITSPSPVVPSAKSGGWLRRIGWLERIGLLGVLLITLLAVFGPLFSPFDPMLRVADAYLPPGAMHLFGTDEIGRDLFSRVLLGIRYTWLPGLAVIGVALLIGSAVGVFAGMMGGWVDALFQRIVELFLVLPSTLIAISVVAALGPGLLNTMIAITIFWWPWYARMTRDEVRRIRSRPHVEAARIAGVSRTRLMLRYLLPGTVPALLVAATLDVANIILTLSLMSFLGLGLPAPAPELGAMTARSIDSLTVYWWLPILPAVVIFVMSVCANLAGDGVRSALRGA